MKIYYLIFVILFFAGAAKSNILRVPQDYSKIQLAIDAAEEGDTVLVSPGVYYENIDFKGKGITVASNFIFSNNSEDITLTIINGSEPGTPDSSSCVLMYKPDQSFSDDSSAALIGFTLTGGKGTVWEDEHGPGLFFREGGGILIQYWAPRIRFNIIIENEAYNKTGLTSAGGGAIRCGDGNPLIENNLILSNRGRYGGGIVFNFSGGVIRNNVIADNYGGEDFAGGGVWILGNSFDNKVKVIENNTIINNSSVLPGGGIYLWASAGNFVRNNIIWGNTAPSSPQIRTQQSSGEIIYNDVEGGYTGEGNIDMNPEFITLSYYLSDSSPCIDAGIDSAVFNDREDPLSPGNALFPSKGTLRNDMGAFGGSNCSILPQIITSVNDESQGLIPDGFELYQNYPNPFNPSTKIKFDIPLLAGDKRGRLVTLKVYDILGAEAATLVNEEKLSGSYEVEFNASGLSSGIYFYKLTAGSFSETKKMILIK